VVSIGLCAALAERGFEVQAFKKGPDYIDPLWLSRASRKPCLNLDFNTQSRAQIVSSWLTAAAGADLALVEGNKGLHDGVAVDGSDSNAELAHLLSMPVLLVLDAQGTTRGIAPLLLGYQQFDPRIDIAGVILNKVAGARHESKLRASIEAYTSLKVLGAIPCAPELQIDERHLGLVPSNELTRADARISRIARVVENSVDMEGITGAIETHQTREAGTRAPHYPAPDLRVGIPRDRAFGFYYPDDLCALRRAGAELAFFDTLEDSALPERLDGLFLGGGFPETQMSGLSANRGMRRALRDFIEAGGPVYAECGGMLYLGQSISWGGQQAEMVGALPIRAWMCDKPVGRGYVQLKETGLAPWGRLAPDQASLPAHEFHYSDIELLQEVTGFAYQVDRGRGIDGRHDGLVHNNVLASYCHLRSIEPVPWAARFTAFVRRVKSAAPSAYAAAQ